ncbi:MAG: hypothetical protein SFW09_23135 [Hyphomicrobiaceae bacterium]|nr:hypothetical protein [Hyphomicrobiaceae bacterium]
MTARWWTAPGLVGLLLIAVVAATPVTAKPRKPRIPPGADPGGVAVAIVGRGVDYTRPEIASRLARDGEGEAIAWDFVDNDARPLAPAEGGDTGAASVIVGERSQVRLVIVRVPDGRTEMLAPALEFAARTPARVVLLLPQVSAAIPLAHLADAARRLPGLLLVVPGRLVTDARGPAGDGLLIAAHEVAEAGGVGAPPIPAPSVDDAAASLSALAARLLSAEPSLSVEALKMRLLAPGAPRGRDMVGPPTVTPESGEPRRGSR